MGSAESRRSVSFGSGGRRRGPLIFGMIAAFAACLAEAGAQGITEYPLPTSGSQPSRITAGPDGNLWFTESGFTQVGRITTSGTVTEFSTPSYAGDITAGPDGNLWFVEPFVNRIGQITPSGAVLEFPVPTEGNPTSIASGPDGNLWFMQVWTLGLLHHNYVGRLTPWGEFTIFGPTAGAGVCGHIAPGPDGALWFTCNQPIEGRFLYENRIARISTSGDVIAVTTMRYGPRELTVGPDGGLWFTLRPAGEIGQSAPDFALTEFSVGGSPIGIAAGPDGNLWFLDDAANTVIRFSTQGQVIGTFSIPTTASGPTDIIVGPDGNLWFTEQAANKIATMSPFVPTPRPTPTLPERRLPRPVHRLARLHNTVAVAEKVSCSHPTVSLRKRGLIRAEGGFVTDAGLRCTR